MDKEGEEVSEPLALFFSWATQCLGLVFFLSFV